MAKVLLAWELGGGLGHCVKLAPLAAGLLARGHEVYFAARDVASAQQVLQNSAVKFLQSPCLLAKPANVIKCPRTFAQVLDQVGFGNDAQLQSLVDSWRNLIELVQPDAVICEHAPSGLLASRWFDVRRIVLGTGFSLPPDAMPLPDLCPWMGASPVELVRHETALLDRVNRLLTEDGLQPLERLAQLYSDVDAAFLLTFPELDHHRERGGAEYLGCWTHSNGVDPGWQHGNGPRVFAYLKPQSGAFRLEPALAVLRELPVHTLAYVPRATKSILNLQSRSLQISTEPVHVSTAFQCCNLAIVNGTAGTSTQSLLAGVPLLMLPTFLEQVVFSRRVVDLAAGLILEPGRTELLAARIWRLLQDQRYSQATQAFAARYASYDADQTQNLVIDRVESLLSDTFALPSKSTSSVVPAPL